ncbi:Putative HMP/thiamine import ATP-binding protein YkoD [Corynebacterium faecale]|uniref:ABC transporter ATP-binding protein n=1 Tax=Corynebacterium faecale TaxID=1758466 RepID=UPI0025B5BE8E|nr:ABC transporter ATP-binding protein [Corynebacterium faecale]WJY91821.1 Putative HMP/thiamine import ATP-binding protein YkoD [Corynebacterium faecale]
MTTTIGTRVTVRDFGYRHASRKKPAFQGINMTIEPGERILLTGDSGSGKSTLLAALAGVLGDDTEGETYGSLLIDAAAVGLVLQDPDSQVIASRIGDDVAFGCENLKVPREQIWPRVERALDMVGLTLPLDHPTRHLSGGQKQRLALAGVIAMGANLILLDEPTANLDPLGQREVVEAVDRVVAETGATLIVVEHRHQLWSGTVDRILRLDNQGVQEITAGELTRVADLPSRRDPAAASVMSAENLLTRWGPARSFEIPEAASTVITGANGSGKTTLALTIGGLIPPKDGQLHLSDSLRQGVSRQPHQWRSADLARRIGTVFQDPEHQFVARTVRDEIEVGPKIMSGKRKGTVDPVSASRIEELLDRLRLRHLEHANPFTLSGGEKRRLSVATALVAAPKLLILDEPTFGQDPVTFRELVWMLRELTDAGTTIVSVTHDPDFIAALGDHHLEVSAR